VPDSAALDKLGDRHEVGALRFGGIVMSETTIFLTEKDGDKPFTCILRSTAQDASLSFEARGLLLYLLSKPKDWIVAIADLEREGGCGKDRIRRILKELEQRGYIERKRLRGDDGRMITTATYVYEEPRLPNMKRQSRMTKETYAEYLQSEHWKTTRTAAIRRAGYRCQLCNAEGELHVHHRTYERIEKERASDLIVLCANCHQTFHDNGQLAR